MSTFLTDKVIDAMNKHGVDDVLAAIGAKHITFPKLHDEIELVEDAAERGKMEDSFCKLAMIAEEI